MDSYFDTIKLVKLSKQKYFLPAALTVSLSLLIFTVLITSTLAAWLFFLTTVGLCLLVLKVYWHKNSFICSITLFLTAFLILVFTVTFGVGCFFNTGNIKNNLLSLVCTPYLEYPLWIIETFLVLLILELIAAGIWWVIASLAELKKPPSFRNVWYYIFPFVLAILIFASQFK